MFTEAHTRPAPPSRRTRSRRASQGTAIPAFLTSSDLAELRSLTDAQLAATSFETLLGAVRLQWAEHDQLAGRVELAQAQEDGLRARLDDAMLSMTEAVSRYEDCLQDQERLESEVHRRNDLLDRLRQRLTSKDAELRESERRYGEQERSFDAERQSFMSQEAHLRAQIHSRSLSLPPSEHSDAQVAALQDELDTMAASHEAMQNHMVALTDELHDLKRVNGQLRGENETWQALLTDQTMTGTIRKGSGLLVRVLSDGSMAPKRAQRKRLGVRQLMEPSNDDQPLNGETEEGYLEDALGAAKVNGESLGSFPVTGSGLDLAAELGRAEVSEGSPMRALGKGDERKALRTEVKQLRDANKALSMYCEKILDRIMARGDYEDILAADTSKGRSGVPRSRETSSSLKNPKAVSSPFGPSPTVKEQPPLKDRRRRGMSMDWSSLLKPFGTSATSPPDAPKPWLRPLSLSTKPAGLPVAPTRARKLEPHEEDEEDARERHQLKTTLKLMGISEQPPTRSAPERASGKYWLPGLHKPAETTRDPMSEDTRRHEREQSEGVAQT